MRRNILSQMTFASLILGAVPTMGTGTEIVPTFRVDIERTVKKETLMGLGESKEIREASTLGSFTLKELAGRKKIELQEIDPETKVQARFQGVSLTEIVNDLTAKLSAEERSHIDLAVLESIDGRVAYLPRAFLVKYPSIQLALKKDGKDLGRAAPRLIFPATTNAKIRKESLLLEPLFLSSLKSVTLTSYGERFGTFILKRRTDPAAMRGEKLFLQNCAGCHGQGASSASSLAINLEERLQKVKSNGHPSVAKIGTVPVRLEKRDIRALTSYMDAFKFQASSK